MGVVLNLLLLLFELRISTPHFEQPFDAKIFRIRICIANKCWKSVSALVCDFCLECVVILLKDIRWDILQV
jgi:hypothetical protein